MSIRKKEENNMKNEQKQSYENPVMEIMLFETEDIMTGSDEEIELG